MSTISLPAAHPYLDALPDAPRLSPLATVTGRRNELWARRLGLVTEPGRLRAWASHVAAGQMFPDADQASLDLITGYLTWMFALDDRLDLPGADAGATLALLGDDALSTDPLAMSFHDLEGRLARLSSPALSRRFARQLRRVVTAFREEARDRALGKIPATPVYLRRRRHTSCAWLLATLAEPALGCELDPAIVGGPTYLGLIEAAADAAAWDNDLVSLERETAQGEVNNLVPILAQAQDCTLEAASEQVGHMIRHRLGDFQYRQRRLLSQVDDPAQRRVVLGLRDTLVGILAWNHSSGRFSSCP